MPQIPDFSWKPEYLLPVVTMGVMALSFGIYWLSSHAKGLEDKFRKRFGDAEYSKPWILFTRAMGAVLMGGGSVAAILLASDQGLGDFGLRVDFSGKTLMYIGILWVILIPINLFAARRPENLKGYPQIRNAEWSTGTVVASASGWILYLLGYEILFRGLLLYACLPFGVWPAIAINACIYSVAHIPKGAGETFGAIPFGIVICWMTLTTGSIMTAWVAHIGLALSNEWVSLSAHPEIRWKK